MADMIVNLLNLPPGEALLDRLRAESVIIRRAQPFELTDVRQFISENFSLAWADEASVGFANKPVSVFLAVQQGEIVGFAAYECTRRGFFGPTGVIEDERGRGIGQALLLSSMHALKELGYAYGIIGAAGPIEFYERFVNAHLIPDSDPGIYRDMLKSSQ
jgi:predicted N-acetyltransferase YhbS